MYLLCKRESVLVTPLFEGYQRELTYRHPDGSYSAFGARDDSGSMWLTNFVLKSFAQAKPLIYIDSDNLKVTADWVLDQQHENGCFSKVRHTSTLG